MELHKLIDEAEFKLEALPASYFINYFEEEFLPKIKEVYKKLYKKVNIEADNLKEAEFLDELKQII